MDAVLNAARSFMAAGEYQGALERYIQSAILWPVCKTKIRPRFIRCMNHVLDQMVDSCPASSTALVMELLSSVFSLYSSDPLVLTVLGVRCLNERALKEAEFYLEAAVTLDPTCLLARNSLCIVREQMVHRWHFHMLNDIGRNSAYLKAIQAAVTPDCSVLDIGSGTGILSMMAVRAGAKQVYACEVNKTLAAMSHDILATNGMVDKVTVLHSLSSDLCVPRDIPERVSLIVTETVDAGLLGEWIIPSLRHAWKKLVLPRQPVQSTNEISVCGHVIPSGATVYITLIECAEIRKQSRLLLSESLAKVNLSSVTLEGSSCVLADGQKCYRQGGTDHTHSQLIKEPYTCERLCQVRGGYRELSDTREALCFDFTDPEISLPQGDTSLSITAQGVMDAIAMWFHLHLDSNNTISTAPSQHTTWEQALFPIASPISVCEGDTVTIHASCSDTLIEMEIVSLLRGQQAARPETYSASGRVRGCEGNGRSVGGTDDERRVHGCEGNGRSVGGTDDEQLKCDQIATAVNERSFTYFVERGDLLRLNDALYVSAYHRAIIEAVQLVRVASESHADRDDAQCTVLDLTQGLSVCGLLAAKEGADFVLVTQTHLTYKPLLDRLIDSNHLSNCVSFRYQTVTETCRTSIPWDIVVCDIISPQGTLRSGVLEELGAVRLSCPSSLILPSSFSISVILLSSPTLRAHSSVLGTLPTLGFDVASYINKYQVTHYVDVDLGALPHQCLSSALDVCTVTMGELENGPLLVDKTLSLPVTVSGTLTGIAYWFNLHLHGDISIETGYTTDPGHWHQSVFVLTEDIQVVVGALVEVHAALRDSCLLLEVDRTVAAL